METPFCTSLEKLLITPKGGSFDLLIPRLFLPPGSTEEYDYLAMTESKRHTFTFSVTAIGRGELEAVKGIKRFVYDQFIAELEKEARISLSTRNFIDLGSVIYNLKDKFIG